MSKNGCKEELGCCGDASFTRTPPSAVHLFIQRNMYHIREFFRRFVPTNRGVEGWTRNEIRLAFKTHPQNPYWKRTFKGAMRTIKYARRHDCDIFSLSATLNRTVHKKPFTDIVDTPDIWRPDSSSIKTRKSYQCKRMSSLFKTVDENGNISYRDVDSIECIDIDTCTPYYSGTVAKVWNDKHPITLPYHPSIDPIRIYCRNILTDHKNGDFDTIGIFYAEYPASQYGGREVINRFFKDGNDNMIEITEYEWHVRERMAEALKIEDAKRIQENKEATREIEDEPHSHIDQYIRKDPDDECEGQLKMDGSYPVAIEEDTPVNVVGVATDVQKI